MRVVILAPTSSSLYSRLVALGCQRLPGVELAGIFIRRLGSLKRFRTDLRREGPRLLSKIYTKLVMKEEGGRGQGPSPLGAYALELGLETTSLMALGRKYGIPCYRVLDFNAESCVTALKGIQPDLIAFTGGGLIRRAVLEVPVEGVLNCHSGLLPRYRGMDTLEWALLEAQDGLPQVGLTLHFMDSGVDTGPILRRHVERLRPGETLEAVRDRLGPEMVRLMIHGVRDLQQGTLRAEPQDPAAGRQYYVIHPRLQARAGLKLARGGGRAA